MFKLAEIDQVPQDQARDPGSAGPQLPLGLPRHEPDARQADADGAQVAHAHRGAHEGQDDGRLHPAHVTESARARSYYSS